MVYAISLCCFAWCGGVQGKKYNNTEEGIIRGIQEGYRVIEIDVGITSDNEYVLTHRFRPDDEIIFEKRPTLAEFLVQGAPEDETALSLQTFIDKFTETNTYFLIDCAHGIEEGVFDWFRDNVSNEQRRHFIFQVHTPVMLKHVFDAGVFENIHYNGHVSEIVSVLDLLKECNVHTCSISDEEIISENALFMRIIDSGLHVIAYTINHERRLKKLIGLGVSGCFSDYITPSKLYNL